MNSNLKRVVDLLSWKYGEDDLRPFNLYEINLQGDISCTLLGSPVYGGASDIDPLLEGHDGLSTYMDNVMVMATHDSAGIGVSSSGLSSSAIAALNSNAINRAQFKADGTNLDSKLVMTSNEWSDEVYGYWEKNPNPKEPMTETSQWWNTRYFCNRLPWDSITMPGGKAWDASDYVRGEVPEFDAWVMEHYPDAELRLGYWCNAGPMSHPIRPNNPGTPPLPGIVGYFVQQIVVHFGNGTNLGYCKRAAFYRKGTGRDQWLSVSPGLISREGDWGGYGKTEPGLAFGFNDTRSSLLLNPDAGASRELNIPLRVLGLHPTLKMGFEESLLLGATTTTEEVSGRNVTITTVNMRVKVAKGNITKSWYENYYTTGLGIWQPRDADTRDKNLALWGKVSNVAWMLKDINCEGNSVSNLYVYKRYKKAREKACKTNDFLEKPYDEHSTWGEIENVIKPLKSNSMWMYRDWGTGFVNSTADDRTAYTCTLVRDANSVVTGLKVTFPDGEKQYSTNNTSYEKLMEDTAGGRLQPQATIDAYTSAFMDATNQAEVVEYQSAYNSDLQRGEMARMYLNGLLWSLPATMDFVNDKSDMMTTYLVHQVGEFSALRSTLPVLINSFSYTKLISATYPKGVELTPREEQSTPEPV